MQIQELLDITENADRDRQLRRHFAPYSADIDVDGAERMVLVVLLNLTLKRGQVDDLCDVEHAKQLLKDEQHIAHCLKTVRWLHTHNLKYPDSRVHGQRLIAKSPPMIPGNITSAGIPARMGWAHDSREINFAKLFSTSFQHHGCATNLALLLVARNAVWEQMLMQLGLSQEQLEEWFRKLTANLSTETTPVEVSPFSKQLRFPYRGSYCSVTPVVSHALMAHLQEVIHEKHLRHTIIQHAHPAIVGGLVGAVGGNIAVLDYPPPVRSGKERNISQTRSRRYSEGHSLFDGSVFYDHVFIDALKHLISRPGLTRIQQRQLRVSALRYLRRQLAVWLGPLIEWRDEVKSSHPSQACELPAESLEFEIMTIQQERLLDMLLQLEGRFHLELQNHSPSRRYAFHPDLMVPIKSQISWLLNQLASHEERDRPSLSGTSYYLHLSGLTVYDASALANPYLCGIPSLSALAGFCHDYERRLIPLLKQQVKITGVAWYLGRYSRVTGKHLPEPNKLENPKTTSAIRRPGLLDGKYCDLGMDLVIEVHISTDELKQLPILLDLLRAALPSRFAGGCLHPPSLYEEKTWCNLYQEQGELFTILSRLPRHGCWVYPSKTSVCSFADLSEALVENPQMRPVSVGYVLLEEPIERAESLEKLHAFAETAISTALCINPVEVRLAGKNRFYSNGFWRLNCENGAILMTGSASMGQTYGTLHSS